MEIEYVICKSSEVTDSFISDFCSIENEVLYHGLMTRAFFKRKFLENIYGDSILVVSYCDGKPVGADAYWRNDIGATIAWQGTDSCVLPEYRGLLIFLEMDLLLKKQVENDPVYGFPNHEMIHLEVKRRRRIVGTFRQVYFLTACQYCKEEILKISKKYAQWWLAYINPNLFYVPWFGHFYIVSLVKKRMGVSILNIIGESDKDAALIFPRYRGGLFILTYKSRCPRWYNKHRLSGFHITTNDDRLDYVPTWKCDCL